MKYFFDYSQFPTIKYIQSKQRSMILQKNRKMRMVRISSIFWTSSFIHIRGWKTCLSSRISVANRRDWNRFSIIFVKPLDKIRYHFPYPPRKNTVSILDNGYMSYMRMAATSHSSTRFIAIFLQAPEFVSLVWKYQVMCVWKPKRPSSSASPSLFFKRFFQRNDTRNVVSTYSQQNKSSA